MPTNKSQISREIIYEYEFGEPKKEGRVIFECEFDKNDKLIKHTDFYMHTDEQVVQYEVLYDKKGNDIQWDEYDERGKFDNRIVNKYDKKNNKIEIYDYDSNEKLVSKTINSYNGKNIIESNTFKPDGKLIEKEIYKYDDSGYSTNTTKYDSAGKMLSKASHINDKNGNALEMHFYSPDKGTSVVKAIYDDNDNMIEEIWYNYDGKIEQRETYTYDEKNNENVRIIYNSEGRVDIKFVHYYDADGNKLKTIEYNEADEPDLLTVYE